MQPGSANDATRVCHTFPGIAVRSASGEEAAAILSAANRVVIVPGYGMAVAQAIGDYGSKSSANWGTDGTNWIVCTSPGTWAGATDPAQLWVYQAQE